MDNKKIKWAVAIGTLAVVLVVGKYALMGKIKKADVSVTSTDTTEATETTGAVKATVPDGTVVSIQKVAGVTYEVKREGNDLVLYKVLSSGTKTPTGFKIPVVEFGTLDFVEVVAVSPDQTKVVYAARGANYVGGIENSIQIVVTDIAGGKANQLAEQAVGVGKHQDMRRLKWSSDGKYITYDFISADTLAKAPGTIVKAVTTTYRISVATGKKEVIGESSTDIRI